MNKIKSVLLIRCSWMFQWTGYIIVSQLTGWFGVCRFYVRGLSNSRSLNGLNGLWPFS